MPTSYTITIITKRGKVLHTFKTTTTCILATCAQLQKTFPNCHVRLTL